MNIVINGGTRGIGRAIALSFARNDDNKVIVIGRNATLLKELTGYKKNLRTLKTDITDLGNMSSEYYDFIASEISTIDILINNAGYLISRNFLDYNSDEAMKIMETNFFGPAEAIRILVPLMKEGAHILNISSMGGFQGSVKYPGLSYYSASKAAIACLTECLAEEFRDIGIKVNCLALGSVQTEMLNEAFPGYKAPVSADEMGEYIAEFALKGHKFFNGKILPVALVNP
jgi:short-subunit dehydrogenase